MITQAQCNSQTADDLVVKPHKAAWWKEAVIYQIYPASFADSTGSGTGDLRGIPSKIPYLRSLGIDVVWLSPICASPNVDMGYDISNYVEIDRRYGTMQDFDDLLAALHAAGIKLVMDLVVNHTSDQHDWFKESRSSVDNPKRDWYIWEKPRYVPREDGGLIRKEPNNWGAVFGGSVWEWDEHTKEYYLHYFCKEQPDLNWKNPKVRQAVFDDMRFWLEKGVDGFRMDCISMLAKPDTWQNSDNPIVRPDLPYQLVKTSLVHRPGVHKYVREMRTALLDHYKTFDGQELMTVGEFGEATQDQVMAYVHEDRKELQMGFDFDLVRLNDKPRYGQVPDGYQLSQFKAILAKWNTGMYGGGWWANYLENHDQPRAVSRWGDDSDEHRHASAKLLGLMQMALLGTCFVYQGQELGARNLCTEDYPDEAYQDVQTRYWLDTVRSLHGADPPLGTSLARYVKQWSRDNARVPMPWTAGPHGGFTTSLEPTNAANTEYTPWQACSPDHVACNVADQDEDQQSTLNFYRTLVQLRKSCHVLTYGNFEHLLPADEKLFVYRRQITHGQGPHTVLVVLNFSHDKQSLSLESLGAMGGQILFGTHTNEGSEPVRARELELMGFEGLVLEV